MDKIIHETSKKLDVSVEQVRDVIKSVEKFTAKQIASGEFKNIRIPGLGLFYVEKKALEKINKLKENGNN